MYPANLPLSFSTYVNEKSNSGSNGRPHFLNLLKKACYNPTEEVLKIAELSWKHNKSTRLIARKYSQMGIKVNRSTITRLLMDIEQYKGNLIEHLMKSPRKRIFYNRDSDSSDFATVAAYIRRAKRYSLRNYKRTIRTAERCFKELGFKDPRNWTGNEVYDYLATLTRTMQSNMLDAVRAVCPQLADKNSIHYIPTGAFREKIGFRKKHLFGEEVKVIREILVRHRLSYQMLIFDLHITLGCREGSTDTESGLTGLGWDRFHKDYHVVDDFECKTRHGVWWRNCPIDIFFEDLPERLCRLWNRRGKPDTGKLVLGGYKELTEVYRQIRMLLKEKLHGKIEPSIYKEFVTLRPHDADKIHCNLLWEAGIPLEIVCGEYLGQGEGIGLVGRGWQNDNIVKRHYLSLSHRSRAFKEILRKINVYSQRFTEGK